MCVGGQLLIADITMICNKTIYVLLKFKCNSKNEEPSTETFLDFRCYQVPLWLLTGRLASYTISKGKLQCGRN